jgi:T5SS/PEP-CTERM-associated repeat protein/autotransporter-associated beta strand protein
MLTGANVSVGIGLDMTTTVDSGRLLIGNNGGRQLHLGNTDGGVGTLSINGGYVGNGSSYLGFEAGGQASVMVSSGTWANGSFTYVGWNGSATINVTGGSVTGTVASIGRNLGSVGSVTVSSGGQWSLASNLTVGEQGTGSLTIGNGGLVVVKGNLVRGASGTINLNAGGTLQIGTGTNSGSLLGGTGSLTNNGTVVFNRSNASTYSGALSGSGAVTKLGLGTLTFGGSAANTLTGTTTVSAGTLKLDKSASTTAIAGSVEVATGATLLISQSEQVNDASAVTLSGGTIRTAAGVDEAFGNGFLDFGTTSYANANTISFGDYIYTPSALLTINNFNFGSTMTFGSNLNSADLATFSFTNGGIGSSSWDGSTFTITAIPEPSTYVAAIGLLALTLWPVRHRQRAKVD